MKKNKYAKFPPMGWNSYDYYDTAVDEEAVRRNADYMAEKLKAFGWEYIVVDIQWYSHKPGSMRDRFQYIPFGGVEMDEYSRLLPDPERFPSSKEGAGFKPLADYVHGLGLKFGIHIMRGIPRIAAHLHGKVEGCEATADMVADPSSVCGWNPDMYGVRDTAQGQAYYDSLLKLYASWGVDFVKCDDICNTDNHSLSGENAYAGRHEIEMLGKAIEKCGRPIVLSLSPGPALIEKAWHYEKYANMWRITDDLWDDWELVKRMFCRCELWQNHVSEGCYPDCDMLPLGMIGKGFGDERITRLTQDEQRTMVSLWCIFGSPLMLGAELTKLDEWTLSLLTNKEVLKLLNPACRRMQVTRNDEEAVWTAVSAENKNRYVAVFNLADRCRRMAVDLKELGNEWVGSKMEELWTGEVLEREGSEMKVQLPKHGCVLCRIQTTEES